MYQIAALGITDEDKNTVTQFLNADSARPTYSIALDPNRGAYRRYFLAARQAAIPAGFIIGKDQKIWWVCCAFSWVIKCLGQIGHPASAEFEEKLKQAL